MLSIRDWSGWWSIVEDTARLSLVGLLFTVYLAFQWWQITLSMGLMTRNLSFLIHESIVRAGHPIYKISSYLLWFCLPIRSLAFRISAAADYPCPLVVCSCDGLSYFLVAFYSTLRRINLAFRGFSCTTSFLRKLVEKDAYKLSAPMVGIAHILISWIEFRLWGYPSAQR